MRTYTYDPSKELALLLGMTLILFVGASSASAAKAAPAEHRGPLTTAPVTGTWPGRQFDGMFTHHGLANQGGW